MKLFLSKNDRQRKILAAALRKHQTSFSQALFAAVRDKACASWKASQRFEQIEEWGRSQLLTAVDLLTAWFETQDSLYQELFAGWMHSRLVGDLSEEGAPKDYRPNKAIELSRVYWVELLRSLVPAEAIRIFEVDLDQVLSFLSEQVLKQARVLFIGDCIQFEVMTALIGRCARAWISIEPTFINERVQPVLRNWIRRCSPDQFDLAFFSPFSHNYLPEYEMLLRPTSRLWSTARTADCFYAILKNVSATLDTLADHFHCPIYVHNTAGTIPSFGRVSGLAKNLVSRRNRRQARQIINDGVARYLTDSGLESHLHLLDEAALRVQRSDTQLGRVYLNSHAFHPTRLGVELGRGPYFEAVYTATVLASKKVVVCDLDNTLWKGVIGEGSVTHYLDRQLLLKELRQRGVLLSINSKNDPRNVHWFGAAINADDFVASRINWNSKVDNMASIRDELNVTAKDFVFIDDRPEELDRMRNAFPEILALDATNPTTWNLLGHWEKSLSPGQEGDRTKLYRERSNREQFVTHLDQSAVVVEDEVAALTSLRLLVKIREANRSGLRRATELINRTNQFNLCGSRTTVRELEDGMGTGHSVVTAEASDKFGSMGVVGVMRVDYKRDRIEIPIFVLSCRAFGFGIEHALLNAVRRLARSDQVIVGHYRETQFNRPCCQLYSKAGMIWDGRNWIGKVADLQPDPAWLAVENAIEEKMSAPENVTERILI